MSSPVSASHAGQSIPVRPTPLVSRVFGEPCFHTDADIAALAFAADGTLYSIDDSGVLRHWTCEGKLLSRQFLSDLETLWCFGPQARILASGNDDLILWETESGQLIARLEQSQDDRAWITAIAFSKNGQTVATGHDDGKTRLWDIATQQFVGELDANPSSPIKQPVSAIAFAPNGQFLATAGEDLAVRVWDADTHKLLCELKSHTDRVPALAWSPDSQLLISAGWDTSARVWRPPHHDPLILLNSHADQVITVAASPDGRCLACADSDNDIYLWTDAEAGRRGPVLRGHTDEIRCLAFSPDGSTLASAGADRVIHLWNTRDGKLLAGPNASGKHHITVIPGTPLRLASSAGQKVRVWNVETGEEVAPSNQFSAYSVAASLDGRWLAIGGTDHYTQLWDASTNQLAASLEATKPPVGIVTFSPDSKFLAHTSPTDGLVWIWTCETAHPEMILIEAADACTLDALAIHPSGKLIACGGIDYMGTGERDGAVCIWDTATKDKIASVDIAVTSLVFDPLGKYLAASGLDDAVYVWDAESLDTVFVFGGHQQGINTVCFDPTGSYLLSGGEDCTVRCWDVLSGRLLMVRAFDSAIHSLAFSPDGKFLFCGNGNTTCYQIEFAKFLEE